MRRAFLALAGIGLGVAPFAEPAAAAKPNK